MSLKIYLICYYVFKNYYVFKKYYVFKINYYV